MFCAECGKTIPEGSKFCAACGTPAGAGQADSPPPPPVPVVSGYPPPPPAPPFSPAYGPPPAPPRRRHPGLVPGIVTAVIIVAAGLGIGLFFGLRGDDKNTASVTTSATVAMNTTTALPTTTTTAPPSTTSTTEPTTTTSEETTTTTVDPTAVLTARVADWMHLVESIPTSSEDLTAKIASYITPAEQATARATEYIQQWNEPPDTSAIIAADSFVKVAGVTFWPDGLTASVLCTLDLACRDGLTTRGLEVLDWRLDNDQWMRMATYEAPEPVKASGVAALGETIATGDLYWSPETLHELKHLAAKGGPTAPGMFMTVEFDISNRGTSAVAPASFQVFAVDGGGKVYGLSATADKWWTVDVQDRKTEIAPGDDTYLWYTFEVPGGADLQGFRFQVLLPGV